MWFGRFWPIVAVLAIAGSLAAKKRVPVTSGTMLTYGPTFIILLIGTVLLVGALTFVPRSRLVRSSNTSHSGAAEMAEFTRSTDTIGAAAPPAPAPQHTVRHRLSMFDRTLLWPAVVDAFRKLDPACSGATP